ncbi:hypothetical protein C8J56DRAFT_30586 [Mycena floridula]|nr:hypothetical protein C8J56DRAFT_30586 [Mycena floridula]
MSQWGQPGQFQQNQNPQFGQQRQRSSALRQAQPTGSVDPRLRVMSSTFSMPAAGGDIQGEPSSALEQAFQQQAHIPKIPWTLSNAEKKSYTSIFRAWDARGTGFISGASAFEIFGMSGLRKDDLARIW